MRESSNCQKASVQLLPVSEEILGVSSSPSGALFPEAWLTNPLRREGERQEQGEKGGGGGAYVGRKAYVRYDIQNAWSKIIP